MRHSALETPASQSRKSRRHLCAMASTRVHSPTIVTGLVTPTTTKYQHAHNPSKLRTSHNPRDMPLARPRGLWLREVRATVVSQFVTHTTHVLVRTTDGAHALSFVAISCWFSKISLPSSMIASTGASYSSIVQRATIARRAAHDSSTPRIRRGRRWSQF